eukprot:CAMPEP_0202685450 /NCGR_PEP_ID=MMETSP1385-20130828/1209_1 /ASSEMBLY_ACC=CAM_ASM_000861 /TAXON_ID=933848 /ORGANISM="Elphidium margaritaceum" /LENGTH=203 /DNA_ID=CAMNT_0049339795 /DNA_START=53 /DNA_END=661 /DNA_ORIENTATION=-
MAEASGAQAAESKKDELELHEITIKVPKGYTVDHFTPIIMAYAQWVQIKVNNVSGVDIICSNANLSWGKWYEDNNKDKEGGNPDGIVIKNGESASFYSCGRENSASGTQGSIDLNTIVDGKASTRITTISWDCPWGRKANTYGHSNDGVGWYPSLSGGSKDSGAIGMVVVTVPPHVNPPAAHVNPPAALVNPPAAHVNPPAAL